MKKSKTCYSDFVLAVSTFDIQTLEKHISDEAEAFEVESHHKVSKAKFLAWLKLEFNDFQQLYPDETIPFEFDICNGCQAGRTVVIFNEGRFPKQEFDALFKYSAWNVEVKGRFITEITFCHSTEKLRAHKDYAH